MRIKLILATVIFIALMGGLAFSAAHADAAVRDGQKCATPKHLRAKWTATPTGCFYVTRFGGFADVPLTATDIDVWTVQGQNLKQNGRTWGQGTIRKGDDGEGGEQLVNGYFKTIRVYWWDDGEVERRVGTGSEPATQEDADAQRGRNACWGSMGPLDPRCRP